MKNVGYQGNGGLYRSRSGMFLGVAKGIAQWANLPLWLVRLGFILFAMVSSLMPAVLVYIVLAVVVHQEPPVAFVSPEEREVYNTHVDSRRSAMERMRSILSRLEKRVERLEHAVTDPEKDWDRRFRKI